MISTRLSSKASSDPRSASRADRVSSLVHDKYRVAIDSFSNFRPTSRADRVSSLVHDQYKIAIGSLEPSSDFSCGSRVLIST